MNFLRWIFLYRRTYLAFSLLLVLLVASLVARKVSRDLEADYEFPLVRNLATLGSTIEAGTINSQAMGAAILFGLEHREVKSIVQGKLPPNAASVLSGMETIRRQFTASAVLLLDQRGVVVADSSEGGPNISGRDMSSSPYVQFALQGTPNVYPGIGGAGNRRGIYLAAPVHATESSRSRSIGVVVVRIGADKLDMLFDSWADDSVMLLSPHGEVFAANHRDWLSDGIVLSPIGADKVGRPQQAFSPDVTEATIEGVRYLVRSQPLEWHDPEGEWRLVALGRLAPWWADGTVLGFTGLAGLVVALSLFWLYTLARHERELLEGDAQLKEAQSIASLGSYVLDIPTGIFAVSDETNALFGLEEADDHSVAGWLALIHPDDRSMIERYFHEETLQRAVPFDMEYRILRHNDQAERWMHGLGRLEFDDQGHPIRMHGTVQDITERKLGEDALRREHHQSQHYLDTTLALMVELDHTGRITMVNRAVQNLLGYAEQELLGSNWFETCLPQPEGRDIRYSRFRQVVAGEIELSGEVENTVLCRDGSERVTLWRHSVRTDDDGKIIGTLSSGLDITERKRLEQQLETILEKSPSGIAVFQQDGPCILANESYVRLVGATHDEVMAQDFRTNESWKHNGLLDLANQALKTQLTIQRDIEGMTSFGKQVALECIFSPISLFGKAHLLVLLNDAQERVQARKALQQSMHQLEQKELAKTRFLAAAGHDLRQPISAANLFVDALKLTSSTAQQHGLIQRLEQSMSVFSGLLECLLDISKLDAGLIKPQFASHDLTELFAWLEQSFAHVAQTKHLRFLLFFPMDRPLAVHTDIELLKSVLMNLVSNAIKFTAHGGILVSARLRGDSLLLQVWDTGIGIAESHLPYIFDEFYQVANPQRDREAGLGLGLASCQRRMSLLGGQVSCRSRPGRGSVFELSLPLVDQARSIGSIDAGIVASGETFLSGKRAVVIEDDKLVSDALQALLQVLGAEVRLFHRAEQALQHDDIGSADYFIVDYSLGGAYSGLQFLERVQARQQEKIRAVILTGETSSAFLASVADSPWPVLSKPVTVAKLTDALIH